MPKLNPFITLFLAIAAMNAGLFGWQRADMSALETRIEERFTALETRIEARFNRLEAGQVELRERLARIEAGQAELRQRTARLEAGQTELRERMARIEGTVAGALARPDLLAQAPSEENETAN